MNGSQPHEGRVEICFNETWGTVCDYIGPYSGWNQSEANVVCKQLGFSEACEHITHNYLFQCSLFSWMNILYSDASTSSFGRGSAPIKFAYIDCRGFESSLVKCSYQSNTESLSRCEEDIRYFYNIVGVQCRSGIFTKGVNSL